MCKYTVHDSSHIWYASKYVEYSSGPNIVLRTPQLIKLREHIVHDSRRSYILLRTSYKLRHAINRSDLSHTNTVGTYRYIHTPEALRWRWSVQRCWGVRRYGSRRQEEDPLAPQKHLQLAAVRRKK